MVGLGLGDRSGSPQFGLHVGVDDGLVDGRALALGACKAPLLDARPAAAQAVVDPREVGVNGGHDDEHFGVDVGFQICLSLGTRSGCDVGMGGLSHSPFHPIPEAVRQVFPLGSLHPIQRAVLLTDQALLARQLEGARRGYRAARCELGEAVPPHAVDALLGAYRTEGFRLRDAARAVAAVGVGPARGSPAWEGREGPR